MAKKWKLLRKLAEECGELVVELMKLEEFPSGDHPGRDKSLIGTTEDELADVLASAEYFILKNKLDMDKIQARKALKIEKFQWWYGDLPKKSLKKKPSRKKSS